MWSRYLGEELGRRDDRPDGEKLSVRFVSVVTAVWSEIQIKAERNWMALTCFHMISGCSRELILGAQMAEPMQDA
jgi:hypothetical protein